MQLWNGLKATLLWLVIICLVLLLLLHTHLNNGATEIIHRHLPTTYLEHPIIRTRDTNYSEIEIPNNSLMPNKDISLNISTTSTAKLDTPLPTTPTSQPPKPTKFALLTLAVGKDHIGPRMRPAVDSKRCYCKLHGYDFILDQRPQSHSRTVHWTRVPVMKELILSKMNQYEWIFYTDIDTMITNWTIRLEQFVERAHPDTQLIFSDGDHVNSGVFFIKVGRWAVDFLDKWWDYGKNTYQYQYDQGPLSWLILDHVKMYTKVAGYNGQCASSIEIDGERCWNQWMDRMGMPVNKRSTNKILFWPCHGWGTSLRGFNFYGHSSWKRHECQHWRQGDFLAHTHDTYEWDIGFKPNYCPSPWTSYLHTEISCRPKLGIMATDSKAPKFLDSIYNLFSPRFNITHQYIDKQGDPYLYLLLPLNSKISQLDLNKVVSFDGKTCTTFVVQTWKLLYEGPQNGKRKQILRDVP
eukprot:NODE_2430_length_1583_cov_55.930822_g2090_i0.p1 GENE.NODE_2430_length_1583_cov_55.930822_g2090_i0~~NODE_2430_length_1583_cov_55.930822_g2090_i0.p1  ORF type:complete len:466 (+),score=47.36 NODE_2430_length_1583_cov_55.930822_g2090_i0:77-1474(+)